MSLLCFKLGRCNSNFFSLVHEWRDLHERMVDEGESSRSLQHVIQKVLQLSEALAGSGRVGAGSGRPGQRGAQETRAVGRVAALRGGRLAPLCVDGGESHELYAPLIVGSRRRQHSDAAVVGRASQHPDPYTVTNWHFSLDDPQERTAKFGPIHRPVPVGF